MLAAGCIGPPWIVGGQARRTIPFPMISATGGKPFSATSGRSPAGPRVLHPGIGVRVADDDPSDHAGMLVRHAIVVIDPLRRQSDLKAFVRQQVVRNPTAPPPPGCAAAGRSWPDDRRSRCASCRHRRSSSAGSRPGRMRRPTGSKPTWAPVASPLHPDRVGHRVAACAGGAAAATAAPPPSPSIPRRVRIIPRPAPRPPPARARARSGRAAPRHPDGRR